MQNSAGFTNNKCAHEQQDVFAHIMLVWIALSSKHAMQTLPATPPSLHSRPQNTAYLSIGGSQKN
jgi:hypothetical protein